MAENAFTGAAVDGLRRIGPDAVPRVLKKLLLLEENPEAGYELTGFRKPVVGRNSWRISYRITETKQRESSWTAAQPGNRNKARHPGVPLNVRPGPSPPVPGTAEP